MLASANRWLGMPHGIALIGLVGDTAMLVAWFLVIPLLSGMAPCHPQRPRPSARPQPSGASQAQFTTHSRRRGPQWVPKGQTRPGSTTTGPTIGARGATTISPSRWQ